MAIGDRMRKARLDRGMTQPQLAKYLRVGQAMLSMIESGEAEASDDLARRISDWIASGKGPQEQAKRGPYRDGKGQRQKRTTIPK
jgi:transcriptional regulator with XRE-family HTH domain